MLNKKAQTEDNIEFVIAIIGIVIGVVALTLVSAQYTLSTSHAKGELQGTTTMGTYDAQFMGTDLLNLLQTPANDSMSFGEFFAKLPQIASTQSSEEEYTLWFSKINLCNEDIFKRLDSEVKPVYGYYWRIHADYQGTTLYDCYRTEPSFSLAATSNITLPTTLPGKTIFISMEVYN